MPAVSTSASWTPAEETAFVNYLYDHKAEAGDGGNFKIVTFQNAFPIISPLWVKDAKKIVKGLQNKYSMFRRIYHIIKAIQEVSGCVWDNETGASITPASASLWDDYVKKHPDARPFRNKGWPHFNKISALMPTAAMGTNVYYTTASQNIESDEEPSSPLHSDAPLLPTSDGGISFTDNEETTDPIAPCKRAREPATSTCPATKRQQASQGAAALLDMSVSLTQVGNALAVVLAPPTTMDPTPRHHANTVTLLLRQESDWFDNSQLVEIIDLMCKDQSAADTYLALSEASVH